MPTGEFTLTNDEKTRLLALFDAPARWCQGSEAADSNGEPVDFHDADATSWDIVGGLCRAFGWERARELFPHVHAHFSEDSTDTAAALPWVDAMRALSDFNDAEGTSFETLTNLIHTLPTAAEKQTDGETSGAIQTEATSL